MYVLEAESVQYSAGVRKNRKLCVDFIRVIHAGSGLPHNKNLTHLHFFVHKNTHK